MEQNPTPEPQQNYEQMLRRVEQIVQQLNGQDLDLDSIVARVEEGYALVNSLKLRLDSTKMKIESLRERQQQTPSN